MMVQVNKGQADGRVTHFKRRKGCLKFKISIIFYLILFLKACPVNKERS